MRSSLKRWLVRALPALAACALPAVAAATTPALIWRGAARINVQCLVQPTIAANADLQRRMCEHVRRRAAAGSPVPVDVVTLGDPKVLDSDSVTLLVHASVQPFGSQRLLTFSVRPFRLSAEQDAVLFAAAPRAAALAAAGEWSGALAMALDNALAETLPWRAGRD